MLGPGHAEAIARAFSLGEGAVLTGPPVRGEQGQIWRLTTSRGVFAAKESFESLVEDELLEEAAFQEAASAESVPVPDVVRTVDGGVLADLDDAQVRVYEWVDMGEVDRTLDPALIGRTVAAIHRVGFRGRRPTHSWYIDPVGAARWDELVGMLRERHAPFAEDLASYRDELVALEDLLEPSSDLQTCHRDLWADNVRRTESGGVCVIDWENCGLADPSQELAMVLFEFANGSPSRGRTLHDTYVDAGGPGRVERPGHFSMAIAQLGHIGEMACTTWLDPNEPEKEREHAVVRAAEFTDLAMTRATIEALLDALR
ncbi:MAG: phosphotransferase enzyme family protein [Actinomycetota bacterium]